MMKKRLRRAAALLLAAAMAVPLGACGREDSGSVEQKEWVYVPEFLTMDEEEISYYEMKLSGDALYYTTWDWDEEAEISTVNLCRYSLTDRQTTEIPLSWQDGEENRNIRNFQVAQDGSIYLTTYQYTLVEGTEDEYQNQTFLCRFDAQGNQIFQEDMTERMNEDPENSYIQNISLDGQGRIYLDSQSTIWLYDAEGKYQGNIPLDGAGSWIQGIGRGKDGKVYISSYSYDGTSAGYTLIELDFDNKKLGASYQGYPGGNGSQTLTPGIEKDFLVYDSTGAYEYDLATQTQEPLFDWLDSDINGSNVRAFGVLEDGRYVAVYEDWMSEDRGVAILTKTKGDQVEQKETILVGTLTGDSNLQSLAVKFNKANDKYRISIRQYVDYNDMGEDYLSALNTAITNMNNDITSKNGPDIIDLSEINIEQLASKGIFEDLSPYLEKSSELNREDFLENVLDAYTYDDKLISIPATFMVSTVMGSKKDLGDKEGWSFDEMVAFADAHPDAVLFGDATKQELLQYMMMFNEKAFIDWSTGKCSFNSDEFKGLLEFVNRFPDEIDYNSDMPATPIRIQNGEVLLDTVGMSGFDDIQMDLEIFQGEGVCIGFPTVDGSSGHAMTANSAYAIASKSKKKDGAWAFIENMLMQTRDDDHNDRFGGFPTMKGKLEEMAADAVKVEYVLDENGEPLLDENGEPVVSGGSSSMSWGGWSYTYHVATQEEVDMTMDLIRKAKPVSYNYGSELINIINEEAQPFFKGQKSVDEVAEIIQSRIEIYVSE